MAKKIYSLGSPKVETEGDSNEPVVLITTKHGQKFRVVVGKDSLQIHSVSEPGVQLNITPMPSSSILIKEKID